MHLLPLSLQHTAKSTVSAGGTITNGPNGVVGSQVNETNIFMQGVKKWKEHANDGKLGAVHLMDIALLFNKGGSEVKREVKDAATKQGM